MGNSSSHSTHNHGSKGGRGGGGGGGGPPPQHYVQSLPRDGRGGHGSSMAAAQKHYNGGFKVLPERVPGQKLRLTDNGSVLHNGGTLSGRKLGNDVPHQPQPPPQPPQVDAEFLKVLRRRSESVQEMRREEKVVSGHQSDIGVRSSNPMGKKYHSDPDLLNKPGIISGNPSGHRPELMGKGKKKKMLRKTKAPPPPAYDEDDEEEEEAARRHGRHQPPLNGIPMTRERVKDNGRRGFASFLKPSSKNHKKSGNDEVRSRLSVAQEGRQSPCLPIVPHPPPPPLARLNAEVTAAKLDSRDKSVTYVLERRHECSSVLSAPSNIPNGSPAERRYTKRTQSPDCGENLSRNNVYNQHQSLQAKLSDSGLVSRSIDRSDLRNGRLAELQKRVRSMDSLACADDDRDMFVPPQRPSNYELGRTKSSDVTNKSLDSLQGVSRNPAPNNNDKNVGMGRRLSNSSSQLSDGQQMRPLWEKSNLLRSPEDGAESRMQPSSSPRENGFTRESNFPKPYFYGGKKDSPHSRQQIPSQNVSRNPFVGESKGNHLRSTSDLVVPHDRKVTREPGLCEEFDKNLHRSQWNRNQDHVSKDKLKPLDSKEILSAGHLPPKKVEAKDFQDKDFVDSIFPQPLVSLGDYSAKNIGIRRKAMNGRARYPHEQDNEMSSEDEMDINMQLRPTLPKRLPTLPRFSPTQVWRSFSLDGVTAGDQRFDERSSDGEEGDVFEDRIHRVARPVAPPRSNNEKSADSGISPGANSPTPLLYDFDAVMIPEKHNVCEMPLKLKSSSPSAAVLLRQQVPGTLPPPISPLTAKEMMSTKEMSSFNCAIKNLPDKPIVAMEERKPTWTPEEDLASDFDAGSGEHPVPHPTWTPPGPEMVSSQPKLISRKDMFFLRRSSEQEMKDSFPDSGFKDKNSGSGGSGGSNIGGVSNGSADVQSRAAKKTKANKNGPDPTSPQTYNSVRKLKRSLSGVLQGQVRLRSSEEAPTSLDDNWSLSRSLPNSLHNGLEGGRRDSQPSTRDPNEANPKAGVTSSGNALGAFSQRQLPRSESGPVYPLSQVVPMDRQLFADLEGRVFSEERAAVRNGMPSGPEESPTSSIPYNRGTGHIVYLPKYEAMEIVSNNGDETRRRAYSDLGMGSRTTGEHYGHGSTISVGYNNGCNGHPDNHNGGHFGFRKPKKFTYQSTVRQIERKQLEQKLSEVVAVKEKQRAREMDLVNKVEEEFQRKRDREKANIRQQLRILSLENSSGNDQPPNNGYHENTRSLPRDSREYPTYENPDRIHEPIRQSNGVRDYNEDLDETYTSESNMDRVHNSLPPMIIPPEDYDMTLGRNSASMGYGQANYSRGSLPLDKNMRRLTVAPEVSSRESVHPSGSSFFSGIGKWMRRQRVEKNGMERSPSRLEPEGAPSSFGANYNHCVTDGNHFVSGPPPPPAPYLQTRSQAVAGAKFSSGRLPNGQFASSDPTSFAGPIPPAPMPVQQRKSIYSQLAALTEKEEMLQKQQQQGRVGEARTAVWISPDRNQSAPSARQIGGMNNDNTSNSFYEVPYDSLGRAVNGTGGPSYSKDDHSHRQYHLGGPSTGNIQRDWSAGQRHSIAVDFSGRDKWTPNSYYDDSRWDNHESLSNIGVRRGPQGNGGPSIEPYWQQRDSEHPVSYHQPMEGSSLDFRRRYADYNPPPIGAHQRSLSFNQIWDNGQVNNQKLEPTSPRQMVSAVQPFGPNKAYHPVTSRGAV